MVNQLLMIDDNPLEAEVLAGRLQGALAVPTHVGVNRKITARRLDGGCRPHARGGAEA